MTGIPQIMGVVNASIDSLTGGVDAATAAVLASEMVGAGATVLDIGGQSLRTDRVELTIEEELANVVPVLEAVLPIADGARISIDTYRAPVAEAAIGLGARLVNDPSGLIDPSLADLIADHDVDLVLAYSRATPKIRMERSSLVGDPLADCRVFLRDRLGTLAAAGVDSSRIVIDVGPDLGKSPEQTVAILRGVSELRAELGDHRYLWALSRKDFIGALIEKPPSGRSAGTFGALAAVDMRPGDIVRVHDVAGTAEFFEVRRAIAEGIKGALDLPEAVRYD